MQVGPYAGGVEKPARVGRASAGWVYAGQTHARRANPHCHPYFDVSKFVWIACRPC